MPWQILAAINEIETDYGSDLSVSTAGAVGWMQFMPGTWLQYGVDALDAGYADPYNPVDAVFAAARYLRAAGAATNMRAAILAYNHSEEYVESVLLRAKLISTYPKSVIETLTGLADDRLPVTGRPRLAGDSHRSPAGDELDRQRHRRPHPGRKPLERGRRHQVPPAATPGLRCGGLTRHRRRDGDIGSPRLPHQLQLVDLMSAPNASVVAVQDGRIVKLGDSRRLGKSVVLRDVYGDVFTYAGLGSIATTYRLPKARALPCARRPWMRPARVRRRPHSPRVRAASSPDAPREDAIAHHPSDQGKISLEAGAQEPTPAGMDKVRLFAHPGNPDASAAVAASAACKRRSSAGQRLPLRSGSVVAAGTVLGRVNVPSGARDGHLRFAIRPAGDPDTIDPGPILANWVQLQTALHPRGAKATNALLGATASDVFLLSKAELEREVLSDPGIAHRRRAPVTKSPRADRQARAGGARVPLAQRADADRERAAAASAPLHRPPASSLAAQRDAVAISEINGLRSPATRGRGRSPT